MGILWTLTVVYWHVFTICHEIQKHFIVLATLVPYSLLLSQTLDEHQCVYISDSFLSRMSQSCSQTVVGFPGLFLSPQQYTWVSTCLCCLAAHFFPESADTFLFAYGPVVFVLLKGSLVMFPFLIILHQTVTNVCRFLCGHYFSIYEREYQRMSSLDWGWPSASDPPALAYQVLELQAFNTTPSKKSLPPQAGVIWEISVHEKHRYWLLCLQNWNVEELV